MEGLRPVERVAGLNVKDRLAGLSEQEVILAGERKGEAALLTRLLQRRFGNIPTWAREKIANADLPTLEEWSLRILDANSLEKVIESHDRKKP